MDGFCVIRTNVPEERMSAADVVMTYKIGTGREGDQASDLQIRPIRHRRGSAPTS